MTFTNPTATALSTVLPIAGYGVAFGGAFAAAAVLGAAVLPLASVIAIGAIAGTAISMPAVAGGLFPNKGIHGKIVPILLSALIVTIGLVVMGALAMPFTIPAALAAIGFTVLIGLPTAAILCAIKNRCDANRDAAFQAHHVVLNNDD